MYIYTVALLFFIDVSGNIFIEKQSRYVKDKYAGGCAWTIRGFYRISQLYRGLYRFKKEIFDE
jgi:hypothetical protein